MQCGCANSQKFSKFQPSLAHRLVSASESVLPLHPPPSSASTIHICPVSLFLFLFLMSFTHPPPPPPPPASTCISMHMQRVRTQPIRLPSASTVSFFFFSFFTLIHQPICVRMQRICAPMSTTCIHGVSFLFSFCCFFFSLQSSVSTCQRICTKRIRIPMPMFITRIYKVSFPFFFFLYSHPRPHANTSTHPSPISPSKCFFCDLSLYSSMSARTCNMSEQQRVHVPHPHLHTHATHPHTVSTCTYHPTAWPIHMPTPHPHPHTHATCPHTVSACTYHPTT